MQFLQLWWESGNPNWRCDPWRLFTLGENTFRNLLLTSKGNAWDKRWGVRIQSGRSCRRPDTWRVENLIGNSPCDTHAASRVTIVKKCVQVKQILPTIGSAALKIPTVHNNVTPAAINGSDNSANLWIIDNVGPEWSITHVRKDDYDNCQDESIRNG